MTASPLMRLSAVQTPGFYAHSVTFNGAEPLDEYVFLGPP
jgi:hypothetical protein